MLDGVIGRSADGFKVLVENPNTKSTSEFYCMSEFSEMLLPTLMNLISFDGQQESQLDANFISQYNKEKEEFDYYVQRLVGVDMENEEYPQRGKNWVPYINGKREDWSFICQNNRIVGKSDQIVWKYVPYEEPVTEGKSEIL